MTIRGIGTDIVEAARVRQLLHRYGDRPAARILTAYERAACPAGDVAVAYLARRFAAKEAAAKALGTGLARGVRFRDIEITNDARGCPQLDWHGVALACAQRLGVRRAHISISDEREYAIAFAILEG